ncbi:hypothetical protein FIBSPDRAFT_198673 [Athelia psychrophila]|uniref:Uncharacterized protein n=1 Tax=Athelia psychrophila TaxID=1759441 RepID=A0A165ZSB9_9AGAM|nr:hypothetical protein FIBSPDRAFT_198673 [Fibularhizoctonia sp. CBS 109695]
MRMRHGRPAEPSTGHWPSKHRRRSICKLGASLCISAHHDAAACGSTSDRRLHCATLREREPTLYHELHSKGRRRLD